MYPEWNANKQTVEFSTVLHLNYHGFADNLYRLTRGTLSGELFPLRKTEKSTELSSRCIHYPILLLLLLLLFPLPVLTTFQ